MAPGIRLLCPASRAELKDMLRWAVNEFDGPVAIRYPRGGDGEYTRSVWDPTKCVETLREGKDCAILTYGTLVNQALKSAEILAQKGVEAAVISLKAIAPLPVEALIEALGGIRHLIIAEESFSEAAIADTLSCLLRQTGENYRMDSIDLGSHYAPHGDMASLYKHYGLDGASIAYFILEVRKIED